MPPSPVERLAVESFTETFGAAPAVVGSAPGRVELLGNHTDYNGGLVLAVAIDRFTAVAGRGVEGRAARFRSVNFAEAVEFDLGPGPIEPGEPGTWGRYVRGVTWALQEARGAFTRGVEAAIAGDVPLGAGLSSSASLQAALAVFLLRAEGVVTGEPDDPARMALARVLQRSENAFVGVASGLLDQFTVLFGRSGHALALDCRSLEFARLPLGPPAPAIVVCDSKTTRRLADGRYNRRRAECESVVTYFRDRRGAGPDPVAWLRDVSLDDLNGSWDALDPVGRLRARHVLTENQRVGEGAEALRRGDLAAFGRLMSASHASSRDDFGNSSPALDALIESAESAPGFLGGKLSGAGWAGCTVNLVSADRADAFAASVVSSYARRTGTTPDVHVCHAADGASGRPLSAGPR